MERQTGNYLNDKAAAEYLNISWRTLQRWRMVGRGPRFHRFGGPIRGAIRYRMDELEAWAESCPAGGAPGGDKPEAVVK